MKKWSKFQHPEVKYMPLYFAIYQDLLAENGQYFIFQYVFDYFLSVTISEIRGQLVGNFQLLMNALPFINSSVLERSSETLCENLKHLNIHKPKQMKPQSDQEFGFYLAGFIEGAGHFSNKNQLIISFHIQDIRLAYYIKSRLGYGTVKKIKNKQAVSYVLSNQEGLLKVIGLINGKIRTPMKQNEIKTNITYPLNKQPLDDSSLTNNYWLAGFCDADGSFQVKIIYREVRKLPEIRLSLQIDQKENYILEKILEEFGGSIRYRKKADTYYYSSISYGVAYKFISYFRAYHLMSFKYVNYLKWCKVYSYIEIREHLTNEGVNKIINQKKSMSSK